MRSEAGRQCTMLPGSFFSGVENLPEKPVTRNYIGACGIETEAVGDLIIPSANIF